MSRKSRHRGGKRAKTDAKNVAASTDQSGGPGPAEQNGADAAGGGAAAAVAAAAVAAAAPQNNTSHSQDPQQQQQEEQQQQQQEEQQQQQQEQQEQQEQQQTPFANDGESPFSAAGPASDAPSPSPAASFDSAPGRVARAIMQNERQLSGRLSSSGGAIAAAAAAAVAAANSAAAASTTHAPVQPPHLLARSSLGGSGAFANGIARRSSLTGGGGSGDAVAAQAAATGSSGGGGGGGNGGDGSGDDTAGGLRSGKLRCLRRRLATLAGELKPARLAPRLRRLAAEIVVRGGVSPVAAREIDDEVRAEILAGTPRLAAMGAVLKRRARALAPPVAVHVAFGAAAAASAGCCCVAAAKAVLRAAAAPLRLGPIAAGPPVRAATAVMPTSIYGALLAAYVLTIGGRAAAQRQREDEARRAAALNAGGPTLLRDARDARCRLARMSVGGGGGGSGGGSSALARATSDFDKA